MNPEAHLAHARARQKLAKSRAEARLRQLGGGRHSSRADLTDGLTAEQIERDAASLRNILSVWKRIGKRGQSTIRLPSGRVLVPKESATGPGQRETALGRPRHRRGMQPW
jgi:hypothetical protein